MFVSKNTEYENMHAMEIYNNDCQVLGYHSYIPAIYDLYVEDDKIHVKCSDGTVLFLNTARRSAQSAYANSGETINEAAFTFDENDGC